MKSWPEILETLKILVVIFSVIAGVSSCVYWQTLDNQRMHLEFMEECKKHNTPEHCALSYVKAYRETFGR